MLRKRMHFYWGNRTMSFLRYMSLHSFSKLNPDWETVLIRRRNPFVPKHHAWNEKPDFLYFKGMDHSKMLGNLDIDIVYLEDKYPDMAKMEIPELHMGDLVQWCVMSEDGGVFSDTDVLFFRPLDHKRFRSVDVGLVQFLGNPKPGYIPTTFMLGQPNGFFRRMYDDTMDHGDHISWEGYGEEMIGGSFGSVIAVQRSFPDLNVVRLPSRIVFPFAETEKMFVEYANLMFYQNIKMPKESVGIHWYGSGTIAQHFNNEITRDNYSSFNSTICRLVGETL